MEAVVVTVGLDAAGNTGRGEEVEKEEARESPYCGRTVETVEGIGVAKDEGDDERVDEGCVEVAAVSAPTTVVLLTTRSQGCVLEEG